MRLIKQVVGQQQVVAVNSFRLALVRPSFVPRIADNRLRIGKSLVAHPDPDHVIALFNWKTTDPRALRNKGLSGNLHAGASTVEDHPVILAANVLSEHLTA